MPHICSTRGDFTDKVDFFSILFDLLFIKTAGHNLGNEIGSHNNFVQFVYRESSDQLIVFIMSQSADPNPFRGTAVIRSLSKRSKRQLISSAAASFF